MHQRIVISKRRPAALIALLGLVLAAAVAALLLRGGTASANPRNDFVAVSAGGSQTCGLNSAGAVECWGGVADFISTVRPESVELTPVPVPGLEAGIAVVSVSAEHHACALTEAGDVLCWIRMDAPGFGRVSGPTLIAAIDTRATALSTGDDRSCVLTDESAVLCWGDGILWRGGDARVVPGLESGVTAISSGGLHACALTSGGAVMCWGSNRSGQLGNGTRTWSSAAVSVEGLQAGVIAITSGAEHSCALTEGGAVLCWGDNRGAELGGAGGEFSTTPVAVSGLSSGVTAIRAGFGRTCARLDTGSYECWGGPFGSTPAPLPGAESGVADVTLGVDHACLLMEDGRVRCWGSNGLGQLGDGTTERRNGPVDVVVSLPKAAPTATPCPAGDCPVATQPPPCAAETCMGLAVLDDEREIVCHSARSADCSLSVDSTFTLAVDAFAVPEDGYVMVQSFVQYSRYDPAASEDGHGPGSCGDGVDNEGGEIVNFTSDGRDRSDMDCYTSGLTYQPAPSLHDEIVWPDSAVVIGTQDFFGAILHGSLSGLLPPLTVSTYAGIVVELAMSCSPQESVSDVALIPYGNGFAATSGAAFAGKEPGLRFIPDVSGLRVACCDVTITSVDALFILQFEAGLTDSVSCGWDGDVDADGVVDSIDAALTLQFVAGLLSALPRDVG